MSVEMQLDHFYMFTSARRGQRRGRPHAQRAGRYQPSPRLRGVGGGGHVGGGGGGRQNGPAVLVGALIFLLIVIGIAIHAPQGHRPPNSQVLYVPIQAIWLG